MTEATSDASIDKRVRSERVSMQTVDTGKLALYNGPASVEVDKNDDAYLWQLNDSKGQAFRQYMKQVHRMISGKAYQAQLANQCYNFVRGTHEQRLETGDQKSIDQKIKLSSSTNQPLRGSSKELENQTTGNVQGFFEAATGSFIEQKMGYISVNTQQASKFVSGRAAIREKDRGPFENPLSLRELNEVVAQAEEKARCNGIHACQDKGLVTGGDDLLPKKEQDKTPMQKLIERKKLQDSNNGAHFDFKETLERVNEMRQELKNQHLSSIRTKTLNFRQSSNKPTGISGNITDLNSPQTQEIGPEFKSSNDSFKTQTNDQKSDKSKRSDNIKSERDSLRKSVQRKSTENSQSKHDTISSDSKSIPMKFSKKLSKMRHQRQKSLQEFLDREIANFISSQQDKMQKLMPKKQKDTLYANDVMSISAVSSKSPTHSRLESKSNRRNSFGNSPTEVTPEMITSPRFNQSMRQVNIIQKLGAKRRETQELPGKDQLDTRNHTYQRTTSLMIQQKLNSFRLQRGELKMMKERLERESISSEAGADLKFDSIQHYEGMRRGSVITESLCNRTTSRNQKYQDLPKPKPHKRIILPVETSSKLHAAIINQRTIQGNLNSAQNQRRKSTGPSPFEMLQRIEKIKSNIDEPSLISASGHRRGRGRVVTFEGQSIQKNMISRSLFEAKRFSHIPDIQTHPNASDTTGDNSIWDNRSFLLSRDGGPFSKNSQLSKLSGMGHKLDCMPRSRQPKNTRMVLHKFYATLS